MYGDGEWKAYKHGRERKTKWIKVHVWIDAHTGQVCAVEITDKKVHDSKVVKDLLKQVDANIECVVCDGAYDTREVYESIKEHSLNAMVVIPPRKNARIWYKGAKGKDGYMHPRDENLRLIRKVGRGRWKEIVRYGVRSRVENVFYRIKRLFGSSVSGRLYDMQRVELLVWCKALVMMDMLYIAGGCICVKICGYGVSLC